MQDRMKTRPALIASCIVLSLTMAMRAQTSAREKVAEGRYQKLQNGILSKDLEHLWILWRTGAGYELEDHYTDDMQFAERMFIAMDAEFPMAPQLHQEIQSDAVADELVVGTSSDLRIDSLRLQGKQLNGKTTKDVSILNCKSLARETKCKGLKGSPKLKTSDARELFFTLHFPLLFGPLVRQSHRDSEHSDNIKLARLSFDTHSRPLIAESEAEVKYLGEEDIQIVDHVFRAGKYQISVRSKVGPALASTIWASSNGLVLAVEGANDTKSRVVLVEYKKYSDF
jgi:hypothetical protein